MIDQDRLHQTNFSRKLTADSVAAATRLMKLQKATNIKQTDREAYVYQVLDSFTEIQSIVEALDMAEIFMRSYSVSRMWRSRYDQNHYFVYHYEMWILNAIRLYERLLILINSVYWLEIKHKDVSYLSISSHPKIQDTKVLGVLNKLHGAMSSLQGAKNSVFHRYAYSDPELNEIKKYYFLARNTKGDDKKQFSAVARIKMRILYLPRKRKEISENNQQLMRAVDEIFKTLEVPYIQHRDTLQHEPNR